MFAPFIFSGGRYINDCLAVFLVVIIPLHNMSAIYYNAVFIVCIRQIKIYDELIDLLIDRLIDC